MLSISSPEIIAYLVNFLILAGGLSFFLYKPVTKMLDQRKAAIDEALTAAAAARKEVAEVEERMKAEITASRVQALEIVNQAKAQGEAARAEIVAKAKDEADAALQQAKKEIAAEKEQAIASLRQEVADLALLATERLLKDGLTEQQHQRLLNDYVQQAGNLQ